MKRMLFLILGFMIVPLGMLKASDDNVPYAFNRGEKLLGVKMALGAVYGSKIGFVVSGEYGYADMFIRIKGLPNGLGLGGSFGYSSFTEFVFPWGNYSYQNYLLLGSAFWHIDVFRNRKVDTYFRVNLGLNFDSYSSPGFGAPGRDSTYGGLVFGLSLGGRYYFKRHWAATAEMGFGMGNLRLGVDYRF